jgi:hypothetical protein
MRFSAGFIRHIRELIDRSVLRNVHHCARAACMAACAGSVCANAALILGPGLIPIGSSAMYEAHGLASDLNGDVTWHDSTSGTTINAGNLFCTNTPCGDSASYLHLGSVEATPAGLALHSQSKLINEIGLIAARGAVAARSNDVVIVQGASSMVGSGILRFNYTVTGQLKAGLNGNGNSLNSASGFVIGYYADAALVLNWSSGNAAGRDEQVLARVSLTDSPLTDAQMRYEEFINGPQTVSNESAYGNASQNTNQTSVNQPLVFQQMAGVVPGTAVNLSVALIAGYNLTLSRSDFGLLTTTLDADFGHTAVLTSVDLLNLDGTPYIGQWQLSSQAGIDYNENVRPGNPGHAPIPGSLALLLAGLLAARLCTPRAGELRV